MTPATSIESSAPIHQRPPIATYLLFALILLVALKIACTSAPGAESLLRDFFVEPSAFGVWGGDYFSLLSAAFIHLFSIEISGYPANLAYNIGPILLMFDAVGIFMLGKRIELGYRAETLVGLVVLGAVVPNALELGLGQWPVYGSTPMVYTLLGFLLVARRRHPDRVQGLPPGTRRILLTLLPLFCLMGWAGLGCGLTAPLAGFILGMAVGGAFLSQGLVCWSSALALLAIVALAIGGVAMPVTNPQWRIWKANQLAAQGKLDASHQLVAELTRQDNPNVLNSLAWVLATSPEPRMRNGHLAVELARRACSSFGQDLAHTTNTLLAGILATTSDTLAAAYAEVGDWATAERIQLGALAGIDNPPAALKENLQRIQNRQPIRDYELLPTRPADTSETTTGRQSFIFRPASKGT